MNILRTYTTYPAIVGNTLAQLRKEKGIQQKGLAREIGITQSTLSKIERGASNLTIGQLAKAAEALQTKPSQILKHADTIKNGLEADGVQIQLDKATFDFKSGLALLGAAALGAAAMAYVQNNKTP